MLAPPRGSVCPTPYNVVRVRRPVPERGLEAGDEGAVVEVFAEPEGYLADFSHEPGFDSDPLPAYSLTADRIAVGRATAFPANPDPNPPEPTPPSPARPRPEPDR